MSSLLRAIAGAALAALAGPALAALSVFATVPEWGALVQELGGDKVSVYVATNALQDPHHVEAKPSLIARARGADLVVATGAELEIGWLPLVTQQAGNPAIQPGKPGYFEAAPYVTLLEKPARLDRAEGDVHPGGNPHIQTDPRNIARVAGPLVRAARGTRPANAAYYRERYQAFATRWGAAIANWEKTGGAAQGRSRSSSSTRPSRTSSVWLGLNEIAALEPKPGVEPTTAHLSEVLALLQRQPAKMVVRAAYQSDRASQWIAERTKINLRRRFHSRSAAIDGAKDLYGLFDDTIAAPAQGGAMNIGAIELSILLPAFVAGLLVTATHVPLGMQVLARGIVFIDLAIAQIAGCGVVLADQLGFEAEGAAVQVAALAAALAGALLLTWTERIWPDVQEAVIGVVFVLGATGSVLLLASNVHGSEHLRDLLVGQILWAQPTRLLGRPPSTPSFSCCGSAGASASAEPASTCCSRSR